MLLHEIGHALGLAHSAFEDSIMHGSYRSDAGELSNDDILGIQALYGSSTPTRKIPPTTTTSTTPRTTTSRPQSPDLCSVPNIDVLLILNNRLYLLYKKWAWAVPLGKKKYTPAMYLPDWLMFLPSDFDNVTAAYKRPNGQIVMFIQDHVYLIELVLKSATLVFFNLFRKTKQKK